MNIKYRKIIIILIVAFICIIATPNIANAGLQANKGGTSLTGAKADGYFVSIRKMEAQYGTLGKNMILDNTTYLDSSNNGIDCHMVLNTEFGTAGILAYSEYGVIPTSDSDTTTGNASGIYQLGYGNYEYAAALYSSNSTFESVSKIIAKSDARYWSKYTSSKAKAGDGNGTFTGNFPMYNNYILRRGGNGIFYEPQSWVGINTTRAVVVCGEGL